MQGGGGFAVIIRRMGGVPRAETDHNSVVRPRDTLLQNKDLLCRVLSLCKMQTLRTVIKMRSASRNALKIRSLDHPV
jgi:hypothetical protein